MARKNVTSRCQNEFDIVNELYFCLIKNKLKCNFDAFFFIVHSYLCAHILLAQHDKARYRDYIQRKRLQWYETRKMARVKGITFSSSNFFSKNTRSQESATFDEIYCDFKLRDVMRKHSGNKRRERDWIMKSRKKAAGVNGATNYGYENRDFRTWPL